MPYKFNLLLFNETYKTNEVLFDIFKHAGKMLRELIA